MSLTRLALLLAAVALSTPAWAAEDLPGSDLRSLLEYARTHHPEIAATRAEVAAAMQRVGPAAAFPDPVGRLELRDITDADTDRNVNLLPSRVGSTKYTLMQTLPFFGKRELRRQAAEAEADAASARVDASWTEIAARIKAAYAQYALVVRNESLTNEIIAIVTRFETIAQARYAGGLVPQQDALRAQLERTTMEGEIIALAREKRQVRARLNTLLGRVAEAPLAEPVEFAPLPPPDALQRAVLQARVRERNPQIAAERARLSVPNAIATSPIAIAIPM